MKISRFACCCLWFLVVSLTASPAWAGKRGWTPPPAATGQEVSGPGRRGDAAEVPALIEKAKELMKVGKFEEAVPLARQALEMRERALGPEHPGVAGCLMLLAYALDGQFFYYQALPLYQRALKIREKALGP